MMTRREAKNQAKQQAILMAALDIFSEKGVAAARVEDIASKAGVAKGTIYLHFKGKEDIFAELQTYLLKPVHEAAERIFQNPDLTLREKLWQMAAPFLENNGLSAVSKAVRLVQAEGLHNPRLIQHYRLYILRSTALIEQGMRQCHMPESLCCQPQILMAPLLHGLTWQGIMGDLAPLDMKTLYASFLDTVFPADQDETM